MAVKKKTAKKKIAKKKTAPKSNTSTKAERKTVDTPPTVETNDAGVLDNIREAGDNVRDDAVGKISDEKPVIIDESELTPTVSPDSEAIQKTKTNKKRGRPAKRSPSKPKNNDKPGAVDDTVIQLLKPDALKTIVTIGNKRLVEAGSLWAMPDGECDDMANAIIAVVDKYFPELDEWGVEATLAITAIMYAVPRLMMMKQSQTKPVEPEPVKPAEPEVQKVPPAPKSTDTRLDRFQ